jgi:hypothetical protein
MFSHEGWALVIATSLFAVRRPESRCKFPLRDKPVFSKTKTVMLDTSVTFYSEISTAIIGAWQRRRAYGQSQVARLLQKEQFSGAGSGTGSIFPYGSFFPRTEPPR